MLIDCFRRFGKELPWTVREGTAKSFKKDRIAVISIIFLLIVDERNLRLGANPTRFFTEPILK